MLRETDGNNEPESVGVNMNAKEMSAMLGQVGQLRTYTEGLLVPVSVIDARVSWGAVQVQVTPVGGAGTTWVDKGRVKLAGWANELPG